MVVATDPEDTRHGPAWRCLMSCADGFAVVAAEPESGGGDEVRPDQVA